MPAFGLPGDHEREPVPQQRTLARGLAQLGEPRADIGHALAERPVGEEIDLLFREIDRSLDPHPQPEQRLGQLVHLRRELASQRPERGTRRLRGAAVDEVGDRFGLREVELVVQERPLRELSGFGLARAERQDTAQQHVEHHRAAMALEFQHVFAGERVRRRKVERDALVDRVAVRPEERPQRCDAWRRHAAEQSLADVAAAWAGDADDADAAPAGRRRDRGDCRVP